jgi:protein-tyrosine-phosphatase
MAEAFARVYGSDVIDAASAGVSPAPGIAALTRKVLIDKSIGMAGQFPKGLEVIAHTPTDVVINMSGMPLGVTAARTVTWKVLDPIGHSEAVFRNVADEIEQLVMRLILELRSATL